MLISLFGTLDYLLIAPVRACSSWTLPRLLVATLRNPSASEDECSDKVPRGQALSKTPAQVFLRSASKSSHVAPAREAHDDIELSPVTPSDQRIPDAPSQEQIAAFRRHGRIHFAALCYSSFLNGWNDGSTGPLLPRIEQNYHVGFPVSCSSE